MDPHRAFSGPARRTRFFLGMASRRPLQKKNRRLPHLRIDTAAASSPRCAGTAGHRPRLLRAGPRGTEGFPVPWTFCGVAYRTLGRQRENESGRRRHGATNERDPQVAQSPGMLNEKRHRARTVVPLARPYCTRKHDRTATLNASREHLA